MTSVLVPDEAASHLGAILLAFNRQIFGSFPSANHTYRDEADELTASGQAASAILIAGTVLEYFEKSPASTVLPDAQRRRITEWRQLRNQAAHGSPVALTVLQARQIIDGVRQILGDAYAPGEPFHHPRLQTRSAKTIRGKYSHIPTSSDAFIARKREDLVREDH